LRENTVENINFLNNDLPDKCANILIADPPYFEVKGEFDFIWKNFDDYLKDVEKWAIECKRLLADNGTLFWYGSAKKIAYSQIILDKYFNLINNLTWNKGSFMGLEESEGLRSFAPCTERILMYESKAQDLTGLEYIKKIIKNPFSNWLNAHIVNKSIKMNDIDILLKYVRKKNKNRGTELCRRWCEGSSIPKKTDYVKLQAYFNDYSKEYEDLRKEYEDLRRPFNNQFNLQEILNFSNEAVKTGSKYDHDTVKPETLTRALILTCSRKGDTLVVPFSGSGTECGMGAKEGLKVYGFEITKKHSDMSNKRIIDNLRQPCLF